MKTILIIDNSVSFTGAFKCALNEAVLMQDAYRFIFVVPTGATVVQNIKEAGFTAYELPMLEIGKSAKKLLLYVPRLLGNTARLKKILRKEEVDVIQMNDFYNLLGAAAKMRGFKGKLLTYVRFLPNSLPGPLRKLWFKAAYKYADRVVPVSNAVLKQLPQSGKNVMLYDAISFPQTMPHRPSADGTVRFLYLANFIKGKGQDYAVQAFKKVAAECKNVSLRFVGGDMGLEKNRQFKQELQDFIATHNLIAQVAFDSFLDKVETAYKEADVALNFSDNESFSMTCAEASFYGLPVIATRCGGPEEIINDGQTGLLVPKAGIDEMAAAMKRLATDVAMRQSMGAAAPDNIEAKFGPKEYRNQFEALLGGLYLAAV